MTTGKGTLVGVRLQSDDLAALDAWIEQQKPQPTRPQAIRTMLRDRLVHERERGVPGGEGQTGGHKQ